MNETTNEAIDNFEMAASEWAQTRTLEQSISAEQELKVCRRRLEEAIERERATAVLTMMGWDTGDFEGWATADLADEANRHVAALRRLRDAAVALPGVRA